MPIIAHDYYLLTNLLLTNHLIDQPWRPAYIPG